PRPFAFRFFCHVEPAFVIPSEVEESLTFFLASAFEGLPSIRRRSSPRPVSIQDRQSRVHAFRQEPARQAQGTLLRPQNLLSGSSRVPVDNPPASSADGCHQDRHARCLRPRPDTLRSTPRCVSPLHSL